MLKHFFNLEWKSFVRSAAFKQNLFFKIFIGFFAVLFLLEFALLGAGSFYILKKLIEEGTIIGSDPFAIVNRFLIYWFAADLFFRYFFQKMPVANIKPLLYLPFTKGKIVKFALGKTIISFFNILPGFFFVPFSVVLLIEGYDPLGVMSWHLAMLSITLALNFLNVFLNNVDKVFYPVAAVVIGLAVTQYYGIFDITSYTAPVFSFFYEQPFSFIIAAGIAVLAGYTAYNYFKKQLYLDGGLAVKATEASQENLGFLDRFGKIAVYLKNDIRLIKRNKRARVTVILSAAMMLYGFFFMSDTYADINGMKIIAGLICTGGFLLSFGGLVPSWDSSYYKLMMSQNIPYREFLLSKWWLGVVATVVSTVICTFYIYFGIDWYLGILSAAIYNIGLNSSVVLWGGAYVKTPIDLMSSKKAFGDSKAFNIKTLLMIIPKMLLPVGIYYLVSWPLGEYAGFAAVAVVGLLGLLFRNKIFDIIETLYKSEKYDTIEAYSQSN